ncbi:MAG: type I restriction enzyme HsdR N-terminal domain-containing protein [Christensenellales bacterium]|jgi:hypothetical protein
MVNIADEFNQIELKTFNCKSGERYFEPIRNIFLSITPEETVRQKMLVFLQNRMGVMPSRIFPEDHLVHYAVNDAKGRIDISLLKEDNTPLAVVECKEPKILIQALQVYKQAADYAFAVNAEYIILVNGVMIQFYKKVDNSFVPIDGIISYSEMVQGKGVTLEDTEFQRLNYAQYYDLTFLRNQKRYDDKIGADTSDALIPAIINFDECLFDYSHQLHGQLTDQLEVIDDLGVGCLNYNDASGGGFGTGDYRLFLLNDLECKKQFMAGLALMPTGKTVNDPKYGTRDGLTVLAVSINDGDFNVKSLQINLNKFLTVSGTKMSLVHNGVVTRKGASKKAVLEYIGKKNPGLVKNGKVDLGSADISSNLFIDSDDVKDMIGRIISYAMYRNEYKKSL